jgi:hypothetical protein
MRPQPLRPRLSQAVRVRAIACAWAVPAVCLPLAGAAAEPTAPTPVAVTARTRVIVDGAVTPAGGHPCGRCGNAGCRIHHGHLAGCRDGHCAPHCPVRPSHFGFYGTRWRQWPGQGVVPVSAEDAATPVAPPPAQVPGADEESPQSSATAAEPVPEESSSPEPPAPAEVPPSTPEPVDAGARPGDQSALPMPAEATPSAVPGMRYPALTGRLLATDDAARRLPPAAQRAGDSARGL